MKIKNFQEVRYQLKKKGYPIAKYGLILGNENSEEVLADIRSSERKVIIPYNY